ncbi:hypothetical protein [Streptomyces sp. SID13726]|uniref:hypothetical protein n=1 Tax=Streptomyces sp. SID13726 TaxID=2706058 RepID=UPI0013B90482|nr:hypothetical protein [Streptomyces sp. SID13726]NEB01015.1 hypothetical protein [Streptomyces sp. SID13726]
MAVNVEISPHLRDTAARLGAGVPYALKVLAGRLADDPDLGRPSDLPGILTATVDGELFEDCPDLNVGYIREPDRVEIRYVSTASTAQPANTSADTQEPHEVPASEPPADPVADAITVREVADAWRRITAWLRHHAPDSYAALRTGADSATVAAVEAALGVRIPVELRTLWLLTAGDDGARGWGCLPGNRALMPLDAVAAFHERRTRSRTDGGSTAWQATWIPVVALGPADHTSGLYLDTATGYLGRWSPYAEAPDDELDTLVTYLEEVADMLEAPALAARDKPGLVGGVLVWGSAVVPGQEEGWRPLAG